MKAMQIMTANRLREGDVVYWSDDGWRTQIDQSKVVRDCDQQSAILAIGEAEVAANRVVDPYLIEIEDRAERIAPAHYREVIRAAGPSVRADLNKQSSTPSF